MRTSRILTLTLITLLTSCGKDDSTIDKPEPVIEMVSVGDHSLEVATYGSGNYTIVLDIGLDGSMNEWIQLGIMEDLGLDYQVIAYNRAGYGGSDRGPTPRTLSHSINDLNSLILSKSNNSKVILVGQSWGATVVRAFSINFSEKVEGIIMLDPWHEDNPPLLTQELIDELVQQFTQQGAKDEVSNGLAIVEQVRQLADIPDIPLTILTAQLATDYSQNKFDLHESLGVSVSPTNFHHELINTGHAIHIADPDLVVQKIIELINNL